MKDNQSTNEIYIFFYSQSHSDSVRLQKILGNDSNFRFISVDNKQIREKIIEDTHYSIRKIPSLLIVKESGEDILYEGKNVLRWYQSYEKEKLIKKNQKNKNDRQFSSIPFHGIKPNFDNNSSTNNSTNNIITSPMNNNSSTSSPMNDNNNMNTSPMNNDNYHQSSSPMGENRITPKSIMELAKEMESNRKSENSSSPQSTIF